MTLPPPLLVDAEDLRPDHALAAAVLESRDHDVVQVLLPALWGHEELVGRLHERASVHRIRGAASQVAAAVGSGGVVVLDEPGPQDPHAMGSLVETVAEAGLRLVLPVRSTYDVARPVLEHARTGRVLTVGVRRLRPEQVVEAMTHELGGPVTSSAARRTVLLSDGQPQAVRMVLDRARRTGVLYSVDGVWRWQTQDEVFRWALADGLPELLVGLDEQEHELLRVVSCAWRLPEAWAVERFGADVVDSLLAQELISTAGRTPELPAVLAVRSGMLDLALSTELRPAEEARLWYTAGASVARETSGPAAQAGLAWWEARVGRTLTAEEALAAARAALRLSWHRAGLSILDAASDVADPARMSARARCLLGLGRIREAVRQIDEIADMARVRPSTVPAPALREALLLARRLEIFRPELVGPVRRRLSAVLGPTATPGLDRIMARLGESWPSPTDDPEGFTEASHWVRELVRVREEAPRDEGVVAQLVLGARLGLQRHPDLGRLMLSSLVDELAAEGGLPDVEECARAVLLMLTMITGWRTDTLRLEVETWKHADDDDAMVPAVADMVAAVAAMQRDRMASATQLASAAVEAWWEEDPYGMVGFAGAVHAACASFVSPERHREARGLLQEISDAGPSAREPAGTELPELRIVTEGMALVGDGRPSAEVAQQLVRLGEQARAEGQWAQEQQVLLLSVLSGWPPAAQAILDAAWADSGGRARMIALLAEAMITGDDGRALEIAETLLAADAAFFAYAVLLVRWQRRAALDVAQRAWIISAVREAQRKVPEVSWVLGAFEELTLSEREHRVLAFLQEGRSTREIARRLSLSPRTVESVVSGLLHRFSCRNRLELLQLGLVETGEAAETVETAEPSETA